MTTPDLAAVAAAATDPALDARVRAACHLVGVPYSAELTWHVAAARAADLVTEGGVSTAGVTDEAVMETLRAATAGIAPVAEPAPGEPTATGGAGI